LLDRLEILSTDILRIGVVPPDGQPDNLAGEPFYTTMPMEPKSQPLIMLVHCPEVVDPSCVESTTDKAFSKSLACHIRFHELEILPYLLPRFARSRQSNLDCEME